MPRRSKPLPVTGVDPAKFRVNWRELIIDLRRHGWTMRGIAKALRCSHGRVQKWLYDGAALRYEDACALLELHRLTVIGSQSGEKAVLQPPSRTWVSHQHKEHSMAKRSRAAQTPGEEPGTHDPDAALAAGRSGGAHKVTKPKPAVGKSKVKGDPERPKGAAVNARAEMTYDEAMALREAGELPRAVLTPQGWVVPNGRPPPAILKT